LSIYRVPAAKAQAVLRVPPVLTPHLNVTRDHLICAILAQQYNRALEDGPLFPVSSHAAALSSMGGGASARPRSASFGFSDGFAPFVQRTSSSNTVQSVKQPLARVPRRARESLPAKLLHVVTAAAAQPEDPASSSKFAQPASSPQLQSELSRTLAATAPVAPASDALQRVGSRRRLKFNDDSRPASPVKSGNSSGAGIAGGSVLQGTVSKLGRQPFTGFRSSAGPLGGSAAAQSIVVPLPTEAAVDPILPLVFDLNQSDNVQSATPTFNQVSGSLLATLDGATPHGSSEPRKGLFASQMNSGSYDLFGSGSFGPFLLASTVSKNRKQNAMELSRTAPASHFSSLGRSSIGPPVAAFSATSAAQIGLPFWAAQQAVYGDTDRPALSRVAMRAADLLTVSNVDEETSAVGLWGVGSWDRQSRSAKLSERQRASVRSREVVSKQSAVSAHMISDYVDVGADGGEQQRTLQQNQQVFLDTSHFVAGNPSLMTRSTYARWRSQAQLVESQVRL
jgi:hypothetical protein